MVGEGRKEEPHKQHPNIYLDTSEADAGLRIVLRPSGKEEGFMKAFNTINVFVVKARTSNMKSEYILKRRKVQLTLLKLPVSI